MSKDNETAVSNRIWPAARVAVVWLGRIAALLVIALSGLVAVMGVAEAAISLSDLVTRATTFDIWNLLSVLELVFALLAIAGIGFFLLRRKLLPALVVACLAWPMGFVIEGSRCDTEALCRMSGWAGLPASTPDWSIRIRPVTDRNEAEAIASVALSRAGSDYSTYRSRRFGDHWLISTINNDGWAGPTAVWVDTRTAATRFVPCPAEQMRCGMEQPVVTDGRVFRDARLGLAAAFPAGMPVCKSWTEFSDEPLGFHAMYRPADIPCENTDQSRTLGLEIVTAGTSRETLPPDCRPLPPASLQAFGGHVPSLPGHRSHICQETATDQIAIVVRTHASLPQANGQEKATIYEAYLVTTEADLAEDARVFEAFLQTAKIGAAAGS